MVLEVDGVNLLPYVNGMDGIKWQRGDLESPEAGRTLDGTMQRGRVATKVRMDITCRPLRSTETSVVLNAIQPEYVTVRYLDPRDGLVTRVMYSNNNPATHMWIDDNGNEWWHDVTFPLIER